MLRCAQHDSLSMTNPVHLSPFAARGMTDLVILSGAKNLHRFFGRLRQQSRMHGQPETQNSQALLGSNRRSGRTTRDSLT